MKFEMIDWDGQGDYDLIGSIETTMGAIMGAKHQVLQSNLSFGNDNKKRGSIIIRAEAV